MAFIEKARADAAKTRAAIEQEFAERQALFDTGKLRERVIKRSVAELPLVYKTRQDALIAPARNSDADWNAWADRKIADALADFASIMGEEVAKSQNDVMGRLQKEIAALRAQAQTLREVAYERLAEIRGMIVGWNERQKE